MGGWGQVGVGKALVVRVGVGGMVGATADLGQKSD